MTLNFSDTAENKWQHFLPKHRRYLKLGKEKILVGEKRFSS
jgi:hypothetical protein